MFIIFLLKIVLLTFAVGGETIAEKPKPYAIFPLPFELPNRNDRSDQCWLRIEDYELVETVTVYCYIAQAFLRGHIHDYNLRKMQEDDVGVSDVSIWNEEAKRRNTEVKAANYPNNIKDWKTTTVLDPTVNRRIYVTKSADCKFIMYSREGMTNYKVDCEKVLTFVNNYKSHGTKIDIVHISMLFVFSIVLLSVV